MIKEAIEIYTEIVKVAIPFALVFEIGNLIVGTFMRVAFGGKLWVGKD